MQIIAVDATLIMRKTAIWVSTSGAFRRNDGREWTSAARGIRKGWLISV
jgi:hypothetical protein